MREAEDGELGGEGATAAGADQNPRHASSSPASPTGKSSTPCAPNTPDRHVISIPAELAFGTGDHATTSTCSAACLSGLLGANSPRRRHRLEHARPRYRHWFVSDRGDPSSAPIRSGGLRLSTPPLSASRITNARAQRNTPDANLYEADVFAVADPNTGKWDVVVANIFADILEANLDKIATALKPGGRWVAQRHFARERSRRPRRRRGCRPARAGSDPQRQVGDAVRGVLHRRWVGRDSSPSGARSESLDGSA